MARLLVLCESSLCYTILASKAINGRLSEVSRLIVHIVLVSVLTLQSMIIQNRKQFHHGRDLICGWSWRAFPPQVCEKEDYHVSWAVNLVQRIYNLLGTAGEKFRFIQNLESMFSLITMEMLEFSVTGGVSHFTESHRSCSMTPSAHLSSINNNQSFLSKSLHHIRVTESIVCFQPTISETGVLSSPCISSWTPLLASTLNSSKCPSGRLNPARCGSKLPFLHCVVSVLKMCPDLFQTT